MIIIGKICEFHNGYEDGLISMVKAYKIFKAHVLPMISHAIAKI